MLRRDFLYLTSGVVLSSGFLGSCSQYLVPQETPEISKLANIDLQLSTVTSMMIKDFEGTLARVAEIGYDQVEFSAMGFLGREAGYVQQLLAKNNLGAPVGRITPVLPEGFLQLPRDEAYQLFRERSKPEFLLENVNNSIGDAEHLGQKYLNLPAMMAEHFATMDQVKRNIELLNQAGDLCAEHGILFGYHNHNWELAPIDGVVPYDLMLEQTDPGKVGFQMDAYWIVKGGGNLDDYLTRFPGRFPSCHMKDIDTKGDFADVGDGEIDFPAFTRKAIAQGTKHFFVERDNPPEPEQSIERSYAYLNQMTF
ncbi:MAG: sugar phosphate isomerase/epimerase [Gammaproteobacteria bacterium]|nr:sugar phosphate isomerase/epimerase [Gammaproteobacteria bacterium]